MSNNVHRMTKRHIKRTRFIGCHISAVFPIQGSKICRVPPRTRGSIARNKRVARTTKALERETDNAAEYNAEGSQNHFGDLFHNGLLDSRLRQGRCRVERGERVLI